MLASSMIASSDAFNMRGSSNPCAAYTGGEDARKSLSVDGSHNVMQGFDDQGIPIRISRQQLRFRIGAGKPVGDGAELGQGGSIFTYQSRNSGFRVDGHIVEFVLIPGHQVHDIDFEGQADLLKQNMYAG